MPQVKAARDLAAYRDAAWLLKRHAVSVLPSVASLKALRVFAHKEQAAKPLVGFGDPIFDPEGENRPRCARESRRLHTRSYPEFWKGVEHRPRHARAALPPLPETADELKAVAPSSAPHERHPSATGCKRNHRQARGRLPTTASSISRPMGW